MRAPWRVSCTGRDQAERGKAETSGKPERRSKRGRAARERAAPAFTESHTLVARDHVPDADYEAVAAHFSADETAAPVSLIVVIDRGTPRA